LPDWLSKADSWSSLKAVSGGRLFIYEDRNAVQLGPDGYRWFWDRFGQISSGVLSSSPPMTRVELRCA
jgi:hypothetical protein